MAEAQSSILIVDDDKEDLSSVERTLRPLGSELFTIKDPHEVIRSVHRHRPDVVIIDALLPGLSGFDLCKQIKSDPELKGTQVLILTGVYLRQQYRQEALQQFKADGFLTKPFRPPELQRLVVQLLARKTRAPQSSFLKKLGLPASAEPKKRGFLGRIFGRSEESESDSLRIAPSARDASPAVVEPPARVEPAPEIALEPPNEEAPAKKAKKAKRPKVIAEQVKSESAPLALAVEEPEEPEPHAPAPVQTAELPKHPADEAKSDSEAIALSPPPPEPAPPLALEELVDSPMPARETPPSEEVREEPSPSTLLDAPPPGETEQVHWTPAYATTEDMTLEEAAARVAQGEASAKPPAAFEDLAVPQPELEAEPKETSQPLRRPLFRVGEVPIYDEPDFLSELKRELSKCKRVDRPLTLILIRVGDLGQIIELFGKDFRERVLWHIAEQAMGSLREVDLVGMMSSKNLIALTAFASDRYGGGRIVSRMRQAVARNPFRVGEELPPIIPALDFGMASFPADGSEVSNLISRAEEDLSPREDQSAVSD
jgi:diguanylate cyclase (GGDEF)-like protein